MNYVWCGQPVQSPADVGTSFLHNIRDGSGSASYIQMQGIHSSGGKVDYFIYLIPMLRKHGALTHCILRLYSMGFGHRSNFVFSNGSSQNVLRSCIVRTLNTEFVPRSVREYMSKFSLGTLLNTFGKECIISVYGYCSVYSYCYATIARRNRRYLVTVGKHVNSIRAIARQLLITTIEETLVGGVFRWVRPGLYNDDRREAEGN
jgi:hypothetical protein